MTRTYFLIYGNPVDGLNFVGPFEDHDAAVKYMEGEPSRENIWVSVMDAPDGNVPESETA